MRDFFSFGGCGVVVFENVPRLSFLPRIPCQGASRYSPRTANRTKEKTGAPSLFATPKKDRTLRTDGAWGVGGGRGAERLFNVVQKKKERARGRAGREGLKKQK